MHAPLVHLTTLTTLLSLLLLHINLTTPHPLPSNGAEHENTAEMMPGAPPPEDTMSKAPVTADMILPPNDHLTDPMPSNPQPETMRLEATHHSEAPPPTDTMLHTPHRHGGPPKYQAPSSANDLPQQTQGKLVERGFREWLEKGSNKFFGWLSDLGFQ